MRLSGALPLASHWSDCEAWGLGQRTYGIPYNHLEIDSSKYSVATINQLERFALR
jgi:hypothetical protein